MYPKRLPYNGSALYLFRFAEGASSDGAEWSIYYNKSLAGNPQFFGPNGQLVLSSDLWSSKMAANSWHHVKMTVDTSETTRIYIDDMANAAASHSTPANYNTAPSWQLSMGDFVGCIDYLRISNGVH